MNAPIDKTRVTKEVNKIIGSLTSPATLLIMWQFMKQSYDSISDVIGILKKYPNVINDIIEIIIDSVNETCVKIATRINQEPVILNDIKELRDKCIQNDLILSKLAMLFPNDNAKTNNETDDPFSINTTYYDGIRVSSLSDKTIDLYIKWQRAKQKLNKAEEDFDNIYNIRKDSEESFLSFKEKETCLKETKSYFNEFMTSYDNEFKGLKKRMEKEMYKKNIE